MEAYCTPYTANSGDVSRCAITLLVGRNEEWYNQFYTKMFDMTKGQG